MKKKEEELDKARSYIEEKEEELKKIYSEINKIEGPISIIIPTYNAEKYIKSLLDSIFAQDINQPLEIIVIDSSSDDLTPKIVKDYNVKLHVIDKASFSHPKTRNMGLSMAKGKYIVFLTQDALPFGNSWLSELLRPFEFYPNLAASYSRQIPRPGCNPLESRDIYTGAPNVDEIRYANLKSEWQRDDYFRNIYRYIRFSNISACYKADLLRANPFNEQLPMVEDQEWCKRMIEKGYSIYYASKSIVVHSHNLTLMEIYKRYFDYGSAFKKFIFHNPPKRKSYIKATIYDSLNDIFYILADKRRWLSKLKWICLSPLRRFVANYSLYRGWRNG